MATLQDLPSGKKFTVSTWKKELKKSTNYGQLSSLRDNQEAINDIAKKREGAIRSGSYDSSRRRSDYQEILRADSSLTGKDKGSIKGILDHWGTRPNPELKADVKKPAKPVRRRDPIDFDNDNSLFSDSSQSKNKPYGYSSGASNSAANYFSSSASSGESKSSSSYKPPRLLR
jgi:hypothetical protein